MRVVWLLKSLGIGGAERLLLEIAPHIPDIEFLPVAVSDAQLGIRDRFVQAGMVPTVLGHAAPDPRWPLRLRRFVRSARAEVVHAQLPVPSLGARLVLPKGVPLVYTEHVAWPGLRTTTRIANALTLPLNDATTAVSQAVLASMRWSGPMRRRPQAVVIPNGIDVERVKVDAAATPASLPSPSYGAVTHLTAVKGVDVLVRAAAILASANPRLRCVVAGDGPLRSRLQRTSATLEAPVDFIGEVMNGRAVLHALDIVVIPSRVEGLPLTLLEAMALGKPIVAAAGPGVVEVVEHEHTGLLVPPGDAQALAVAIERVHRDPTLAARLGRAAARVVAERWHARDVAAAYAALYRRISRT